MNVVDTRKLAEPDLAEDRAGGIQVIARAASVLRALESHPEGLSLGQIAKSVGLARSTVQRIVSALAAEDFLIAAGPGGGVRIGPGLARLAQSVNSNAVEMVRPYLRALGEEVEETVDLATLSGGSVVFMDQAPGKRRLIALSAIGERFPLHCTANGKAVLACFAPEDAAELIDKSLSEHPGYPLRNRRALLREIETVRQTHLAYDLGEHGDGISAIGTAFLDVFGRPLAVSIPAPSARFDEHRKLLAKSLLAFRERVKPLLTR
ncbi:MAG: IclR family transcriptional regulator [Hyphomicrobiales bacterium]|nr:IclR family transcriptional regulator [Hyphomicrobiales bacterium]